MLDAAVTVPVLRCEACGTLDPGPRELCSACFSADMVPAEIAGAGRLVSWTVIRRPPTKFRGEGAYAVAIVDLDAGLRVTGRLADAEEGAPAGMRVAAIRRAEGYVVFARAPE